MTRPALVKQLVWLGMVGGAATLTYAALAWIGAALLRWPAPVASIGAYALAALVSYVGHRSLTFRCRRPHRETVSRFAIVTLVGYATAFAVPGVVSGWLHGPVEASIAVACLAIPAMNYLALSRLVFRVG